MERGKALFFSPFPPPSSFICGGRSRSLMHTAACRALYIIIIQYTSGALQPKEDRKNNRHQYSYNLPDPADGPTLKGREDHIVFLLGPGARFFVFFHTAFKSCCLPFVYNATSYCICLSFMVGKVDIQSMSLNAVLSGAHERSYNSVLFLPARKEGWRFSCPSPSSIPRSTITMRQVTKVAPRPRPSSSFSLVFLARRRLRLLPASSAKRSEERRRKQIKVRKQTFASSFPRTPTWQIYCCACCSRGA